MASKIQSRSFYVPITPYRVETVEDEYNELSVMVAYADWRHYFYVSLHAGWKSSFGSHGSMIMGDNNPLTASTSIVIKQAPRNSQKTIDEMYANLSKPEHADTIRRLFDARNWQELKACVVEIALHGKYTAKENENENENKQTSETMAQNLKAADLIGKTVSVKGIDAKYVIKSVDGDKLMTDFYRAKDAQPISCPLPWATLEAKLKEGVYIIAGASEECRVKSEESATATADEVEEVEDVQPQPAKTTKKPRESHKEPKAKSEGRRKTEDVKAQTSDVNPQPSVLKYSTYINKKGRSCARIVGFKETDAAYQKETAVMLHGAPYVVDGALCLLFGKAYVAFAKQLCDALNDGKSIDDCKKLLADYEAGRTQAKAEETTEASHRDSAEDYAVEMIERLMRGDELPESIVKRLNPETVKAFMAKAA